jgi:hypothetical protein
VESTRAANVIARTNEIKISVKKDAVKSILNFGSYRVRHIQSSRKVHNQWRRRTYVNAPLINSIALRSDVFSTYFRKAKLACCRSDSAEIYVLSVAALYVTTNVSVKEHNASTTLVMTAARGRANTTNKIPRTVRAPHGAVDDFPVSNRVMRCSKTTSPIPAGPRIKYSASL